MKIKFLTTQEVEAQGEIVKRFEAGEIYELETSSAKRWLRRNVATEVQGAVKPAPKKSQKQDVKPVAKRKYVRKAPITSTKVTSGTDDSDTGGRPVPVTAASGQGKTSNNDSDK